MHPLGKHFLQLIEIRPGPKENFSRM